MSTNRFLTLISGVPRLVSAIASSIGVADANKIVATNAQGKIDSSVTDWANPGTIGSGTANTGNFTALRATSSLSIPATGVDVTMGAYERDTSGERGFTMPLLKITQGRFDFDPLDNKAEFRLTGASTQFNVFNTTQAQLYFQVNADRTVNVFNTLSVNGVAVALSSDLTAKQNTNARLTAISSQANPATVKNIQLGTDGSIVFADPATGGSGSTDWANPGTIGSGTANTGRFTTLNVTDATASTSTTSGAQTIAGGLGVAGTINANALALTTALPVSSGGTGAATAIAARESLGAQEKTHKYTGSSVPTGMSVGDLWLETTAANVTRSWFWNGTNWLSTEYAMISCPSASNLAAASDRGAQVSRLPNTSGLFVERIGATVWTATAHSGTLFYTFTPGYWARTNTTNSTNWAAFNTQTLLGSQSTWTDFGTTVNQAILWDEWTNQFRWNITKTSTPTNINYAGYCYARYIR